jgi:hypothetical protein
MSIRDRERAATAPSQQQQRLFGDGPNGFSAEPNLATSAGAMPNFCAT